MIVVDVETTGLTPYEHGVCSIGAVVLEPSGWHHGEVFYRECRPRPEATVDPAALAVNGFTREDLADADKPPEGRAVQDFLKWAMRTTTDHTLAGHNPRFDLDFLRAALECGDDRSPYYNWPLGWRIVDLHTLVYAAHVLLGRDVPLYRGTSALGLNKCLAFVGLPKEPDPHNALTGAKMEAEALSRLLWHKSLWSEFGEYEFGEYPIPAMLLAAGLKA